MGLKEISTMALSSLGAAVHGTVLAAAPRMMNEPSGGRRVTRALREVAVQPVADSPTDNAAGEEVDGSLQPALLPRAQITSGPGAGRRLSGAMSPR